MKVFFWLWLGWFGCAEKASSDGDGSAAAEDTGLDTGWVPESGWPNNEVQRPEDLVSGLLDPRGIVLVDGVPWVAEMDGGRVVRVVDGTIEELVNDLGEPYMLAAYGDGVVLSDQGLGAVLTINAAGETTTLADGLELPGRVVVVGDTALWIDVEAEELWIADLLSGEVEVLVDGLDEPLGLAADDTMAWVAEQGDEQVTAVTLSTGAQSEVQAAGDVPWHLALDDEMLFSTERQIYWPYAGWTTGGDPEDELETLSYTPPEPEFIAVGAEDILFSSKQTISRVSRDGGTYESVVIQTSVGDMLLDRDDGTETLWWTDQHRGTVHAMEL